MTPQFDGVDHEMEVLKEYELKGVEIQPNALGDYWYNTEWAKRAVLTIRRLQENEVRWEARVKELERGLDITRKAANEVMKANNPLQTLSPQPDQHLENIYDQHGNVLYYSSIRVFLENVKKFRVEWPEIIEPDTFNYGIVEKAVKALSTPLGKTL